MLFRRDDVCSSKKWNEHTSSSGGFSLPVLLIVGLSTLALIFTVPVAWKTITSPNQAQAQEIAPEPTLTETFSKIFTVNIPASFKELVTMAALEVEGETLFGGSVTFAGGSIFDGQITLQGDVFADGINIDLGSGEITASNVLYSLIEGDGIDISTGQTPTITNSDKGSSQNIFKKVKLGSDNIEADSNTDTLEFASGAGISLSIDTSNDKLTISNSAVPGFVKSGTYALFADGVTRVGVNTSTPSNTMEINSGTDGDSGVTFTQMTSSSTAGVGGGKVLSVDSGGKIILVSDQTGSTPTAESVLPTATNGMTLYFNGTTWVASDNLFHDGGSVGISNAAPTSRFHVNTNLASKIGVIVQGYTSQTANLQEWRNSSGTILSYVDSNGVFNGSANTSGSLNPGFTTGSVAFQGASGLTQDNANFFWDDTNNRLGIGTNSLGGKIAVLHHTGRSFYMDSVGLVNVGSYTHGLTSALLQIVSSTAGDGPVLIRHAASPTSSYLSVQQSTGASVFEIGSNTNIGIGDSTPTEGRLTLNHATGVGLHLTNSSTGIGMHLVNTAADGDTRIAFDINGGSVWNVGVNDGDSDKFMISSDGSGTLDNNVRLTIDTSGNVGIGTTSPQQLLDVQGKMRIEASGQYSSITNGIEFETSGVVVGNIFYEAFALDTEQRGLVIKAPTAGTSNMQFQLGGANTELYIRDSAQNALVTFQNGGNVGIGTTSPNAAYKLDVNGHIKATDTVFADGGSFVSFNAAGATIGNTSYGAGGGLGYTSNQTQLWAGTGFPLVFGTAGTETLRLSDTGYLGIGTNNPTSKLHVADSTTTTSSYNSVSHAVTFTPSADTANALTGFNVNPTLAGTNSSGNTRGLQAQLTITNTNANNNIANALMGRLSTSGTGRFVNGSAVYAYMEHNSTASVSNYRGFHVENLANAGTITNTYGVYVGDITTGTQTNTPYSFYASDANALNYFAGNVGIGTATPGTNKLLVKGGTFRLENSGDTNGFTIDPAGTITGNGNALTTLTASGYALGSLIMDAPRGVTIQSTRTSDSAAFIDFKTAGAQRMFIGNDGNIGIGTPIPTSKLHVEGPTGSALGRFNQTGTGDILTASASGTTRLVVTNAGNVGIGTNLPTLGLTLIKDVGNAGAQQHNALASFTQSGSTSDGVSLGYYSRTGSAIEGGSVISTSTSNYLYLGINSGTTPLMRVGSGQVYIGTTATPNLGQILTINGGVSVGGSGTSLTESSSYPSIYGANLIPGIGVTGDLILQARNTTGENGIILATGAAGEAAARLTATYNGMIGIGTMTPTSFLHLESTSGNSLARFNQTGSGDILTASASGTTRMVLTNAGNLGIGTTTPNSALTVAGTSAPTIDIHNLSTGTLGGSATIGKLDFIYQEAIDGKIARTRIETVTGANHRQANLNFYTSSDGTLTKQLSISSTGLVSVLTNNLSVADSKSVQLGNGGNLGKAIVTPSGGMLSGQLLQLSLNTSNVNGFQLLTSTGSPLFEVANSGNTSIAGNLGIGATTFGTSASRVLAIAGSTAPSTAITDGIQLFAVDQAGSHELRVMDEAGNTTTLSPHNFSVIGDQSEEMAWSFYSERNSLAINADMTKALRLVEKLSGEKLVYLKDLESGFMLEDNSDATHLTELADNGTIGEIAKWNYELWTYIGEVVFEKPVTFLASISIRGKVVHDNRDTAGIAVVKAGATSITITFDSPYAARPIVTLTPEGKTPSYFLENVTPNGFTITLQNTSEQDSTFSWSVTATKNLRKDESASVPIPVPTPQTSPSPLTSPSIEPSPSSSPSAQPTSTPTPNSSSSSGQLKQE